VHLIIPAIAPRLTQPVTEMSTGRFLGVKGGRRVLYDMCIFVCCVLL
jgi:hypothetical protein